MALTAPEVRNNALDNDVVDVQLCVALVQRARLVLAETTGADLAARKALAKSVVANPASAAQQWKWYLLTDPALTMPLTVAKFVTMAANGWSLMAGA